MIAEMIAELRPNLRRLMTRIAKNQFTTRQIEAAIPPAATPCDGYDGGADRTG
jgi:hypothetical protein